MITAINYILNIMTSSVYLLNFAKLGRLLQNDSGRLKYRYIALPYVLSGAAVSFYMSHPETVAFMLSLIVYYSIPFIAALISSRSKLTALYSTLTYLTIDSIAQSIPCIILRAFDISFDREIVTRTTSVIIGIAAYIFMLRTEAAGERFRDSLKLISRKIYVLLLIVLTVIGNLCGNLSSIASLAGKYNRINYFLTAVMVLLFLIIMVSFVFSSISRQYYENISGIMEKAVEQQLEHYEKVGELDEELRRFRHDYRNHMSCLRSLMDEGEYARADEYLRGITKQELIDQSVYFTGNRTADAILSDKNRAAEKLGGSIAFSGSISEKMSPADLCTILSNALDNSVESCGRLSDGGEKQITVECAVIRGVQVMRITNPNLTDSTDTVKPDRSSHGFGLYNIRRTVERLDGHMEIPRRVPEFVLELEVPLDTFTS